MRFIKLIHAAFVTVPMIAGLLIYLLFRAPVTGLHAIFNIQTNFAYKNNTGNFYLYHLPDFLWAFSFTYIITWNKYPESRPLRVLFIVQFLLSVEFLQLFIKGATFDWLDIAVELVAVFMAIIVFNKITLR